MPRFAQLIMGPAGSGKSTYCSTMQKHCQTVGRSVEVLNLDPAAEQFDYSPLFDIRDVISIDDVMDDEVLKCGPNGGLVWCMEHLVREIGHLTEALDDVEDDYIIIDCPGQIELYTHLPVMGKIVSHLRNIGYEVCGVFIMDAQFLTDPAKLVSGFMCALSNMTALEIPHVNVVSKIDLLSSKKEIYELLDTPLYEVVSEQLDGHGFFGKHYKKLTNAIANLVESFSLVRFLPLEKDNEDSVCDVLLQIDFALGYGDDIEHKDPRETYQDDDDQGSYDNWANGICDNESSIRDEV